LIKWRFWCYEGKKQEKSTRFQCVKFTEEKAPPATLFISFSQDQDQDEGEEEEEGRVLNTMKRKIGVENVYLFFENWLKSKFVIVS
jgi:hypothetical protein